MTAGIIATSDPRASHIGAEALTQGGNALDAAVTAALCLWVLEPHACGLGGDAFVLMKEQGRPPVAVDGSGAVPAGLVLAAEAEDFAGVPRFGPTTFTVPGAADLFASVLADAGTFDLARAVAPARALAADGFEVRETLAGACERLAAELAADDVLSRLYLRDGRPVRQGEWIRNDRLADALGLLARRGPRELYEGELAGAVVQRARAVGGYLDAGDLAAHRTTPMQPIAAPFQGAEVWELPPPTQGTAVLTALRMLEDAGRWDFDAQIDAIVEGMLLTGVDLRERPQVVGAGGDTTYVAAIDEHGFAVSLITSIFSEFGSAVGVDALGGALQNRATGISLAGQRPAPGKPPHTTIPALVTSSGDLSAVLGVVGGYMQAQGQVQVLVNLLVRGMGPQEAIDAPRFRVLPGRQLSVEPGHELAARFPEALGRDPGTGGFGGGQIAMSTRAGLSGGADRRRGGAVAEVRR